MTHGTVIKNGTRRVATGEFAEPIISIVADATETTEREHLKAPSEKDKDALIARVKEMSADGMSAREIAENVGISHTTVNRYLKEVVTTGTSGTNGTSP